MTPTPPEAGAVTPERPRGVVVVDAGGQVLAQAQLDYVGTDPFDPTMHVWSATFPGHATDALLLGHANLHIDTMPARTSLQVEILDSTP